MAKAATNTEIFIFRGKTWRLKRNSAAGRPAGRVGGRSIKGLGIHGGHDENFDLSRSVSLVRLSVKTEGYMKISTFSMEYDT